MTYEVGGKTWADGKQTNTDILFYLLKDKLISWKHEIKPHIRSDDKKFLYTPGIVIYNDRNQKDIAGV